MYNSSTFQVRDGLRRRSLYPCGGREVYIKALIGALQRRSW